MSRAGADARVLDQAGPARAMTAVIGIMLFLTVLAAALGLGTRAAARSLDQQLAGRWTIQVAENGPDRGTVVQRLTAALRTSADVSRVTIVPPAELARLLAPWLGSDTRNVFPIPAMLDVDLRGDGASIRTLIHRIAPAARIDAHADWMAPVGGFMAMLTAVAAMLVLLMATATAAVVMLAVRSGLEIHRGTVEIMHMLGSTDVQIARLFQRRIALDAAVGGGVGAVAALSLVALVMRRLSALGSELIGGAALGTGDWVLLMLLLPIFVGLAVFAARRAILAELKRTL